jgi:hypothetical protein
VLVLLLVLRDVESVTIGSLCAWHSAVLAAIMATPAHFVIFIIFMLLGFSTIYQKFTFGKPGAVLFAEHSCVLLQ